MPKEQASVMGLSGKLKRKSMRKLVAITRAYLTQLRQTCIFLSGGLTAREDMVGGVKPGTSVLRKGVPPYGRDASQQRVHGNGTTVAEVDAADGISHGAYGSSRIWKVRTLLFGSFN